MSRPVVLFFSAPPTQPMFSSVLPPQNSGWHPFALTPGSTGARALLRPAISGALALSVALSADGVLGSGTLQRFSWPTRLSHQLFWQVTARPSGSTALLLLLKVIFQKTPNSKNTNSSVSRPSEPPETLVVGSSPRQRWFFRKTLGTLDTLV